MGRQKRFYSPGPVSDGENEFRPTLRLAVWRAVISPGLGTPAATSSHVLRAYGCGSTGGRL